MKNAPLFRFRMALAALLLAALPAAVFAADSMAPASAPVGTFAVPTGLTNSDIKEAIVASLLARQWRVEETTDSRIVGHLIHRGVDATTTFTWDSGQITMYCEGWKVNKAGVRGKPEYPKRWVENLKKDIPARLARTAAAK